MIRAARSTRACLALGLGLGLGLGSARASAEPPRESHARAELSEAEVARRIDFLETRFERGDAAAKRWWYGWFTGFTLLTVGQGIAGYAVTDKGLRADMAVGAFTSALGVGALGLFPFTPKDGFASMRRAPARTAEERRRKLALGERMLESGADGEDFGHSWITHGLGALVSVGSGLLLGLVYDRPASGVVNGVGGMALVEVQIFTQPTAAIDDWREYRRMTGRAASARAPGPTLRFAPFPGGLSIVGAM